MFVTNEHVTMLAVPVCIIQYYKILGVDVDKQRQYEYLGD